MAHRVTATGGRPATSAVVPGIAALSVGRPETLPEPAEFHWTELSNVARLESGHTPSRSHPEYWDGDIPWIGIRDATAHHGRILRDTEQHVSQLGIDNSSARVLPPNTVCLSRTASVGYVVQTERAMATSQDFVNWVCGPDLSAAYLRYLLVSESESVRRFAYGSVHKTMYYPDAKALYVLLPPLPEQQAIAEVLGALDDKIAANTALAETALAVAGSEFSSARRRLTLTTARFMDVADVGGGGTPRTKNPSFWDGGIAWATPTDITALPGPFLEATHRTITDDGLANCSSKLYPSGSILMTSRATVGAMAIVGTPTAVNQGFIVVEPHREVLRTWLFHDMKSRTDEFISWANGATFLELSRGNFKKLPVQIPDRAGLEHFAATAEPLHEVARSALTESRTLAATRDALLPQLMSGTLRVRDLAAIVRNPR